MARWRQCEVPTAPTSASTPRAPSRRWPSRPCCGTSARLLEVEDRLDDGPYSEPRSALRHVGIVGLETRRASDVEVRPGPAGDELLEKQTRGQRAAIAPGRDVLEVGDLG